MGADRLSTGIGALDDLLGGGLDTDDVTEIYGEGGTGKTIFCLQMALGVARADRWVFYIDTEGVSVEKLETMAGPDLPQVLGRLLISSPGSLAEQAKAVRTATRLARSGRRPVGLLVLDTATFYYRLALGGETEEAARRELGFELADLVATALRVPVPVVFTNQVWQNVDARRLEPLGGMFLNHAAKTILRFERIRAEWRRAVLVKHRSRPEGAVEFRITDRGLV